MVTLETPSPGKRTKREFKVPELAAWERSRKAREDAEWIIQAAEIAALPVYRGSKS